MPRRLPSGPAFAFGMVALAASAAAAATPPGHPTPGAHRPPAQLIAPAPRAREVQAAMNLLDPDGKGYVTEADFARGRPLADRLFAALDRDGNGTIERREFIAGNDGSRAAEFARLDRKKDGRVTLAEFKRGWSSELFHALSNQRTYLVAGDLRPGFSTAASPAAPPPPPAPAPVAAPRPSAGGVCWVPLLADGKHWALIFPWSPLCR